LEQWLVAVIWEAQDLLLAILSLHIPTKNKHKQAQNVPNPG
jgi:hypothetical protein